jgi:hypothetical protein
MAKELALRVQIKRSGRS